MAQLFVDSTYDIHLGLLSEGSKWTEFTSQSGKRASVILQSEAHRLCHSHGISVKDLAAIVTVAGPGFYTGLRLSEGFADVFRAFNVPSYSFYSYEIPKWCGHTHGVWMTKAYRGEYFFHQWDGKVAKNILIPAKELPDYLKQYEEVFIHSVCAIDELAVNNIKNYVSTLDLIRKMPEIITQYVVLPKAQRESYYFRAPEDEFRVSV